jgi:hypothetical protein
MKIDVLGPRVTTPRKRGVTSSASTQTVIVFCFGLIVGWLGATSLSYQRYITTTCSLPGTKTTSSGPPISPKTPAQPKTDFASTHHHQHSSNDDGWHSIDIFVGQYGSDSRNYSDSTEWVAQARQDEAIFTLLHNKSNGFFVDLAANDAILLSNTYSLERHHGWNGICIEPNQHYWENLTHYRQNCRIVGAVVGSERNQPVHFYYKAGDHGGIAGTGFDNGPKFIKDSRLAYTVTLHEILQRHRASMGDDLDTQFTIDYLSLDVEGAEAFILEGFPIDEYSIHLLTVERPKEALRTLLEAHGFEQIQRLSRWGETLWAHKDFRSQLDLSRLEEFSGKNQYLTEKARQERELTS